MLGMNYHGRWLPEFVNSDYRTAIVISSKSKIRILPKHAILTKCILIILNKFIKVL